MKTTTTTTIIISALWHCKIRSKIMTSKYELRITSTYSNIYIFFSELRFSIFQQKRCRFHMFAKCEEILQRKILFKIKKKKKKKGKTLDLKLEGFNWRTGEEGPYSASQRLNAMKINTDMTTALLFFLILVRYLSLSLSLCFESMNYRQTHTHKHTNKGLQIEEGREDGNLTLVFLLGGATCVHQSATYTSAPH